LVNWVGSLELFCCRLEHRRSRIHSSASASQYSISFLAAAARSSHQLEIVELAFRIHRPLRYGEMPTLPASRQRQTKQSFSQSDETVHVIFDCS
jgi:hypothetical protein